MTAPGAVPQFWRDPALPFLEARSIQILREAYFRLKPLAMLWSLGKDSNVMVWLARKPPQ